MLGRGQEVFNKIVDFAERGDSTTVGCGPVVASTTRERVMPRKNHSLARRAGESVKLSANRLRLLGRFASFPRSFDPGPSLNRSRNELKW